MPKFVDAGVYAEIVLGPKPDSSPPQEPFNWFLWLAELARDNPEIRDEVCRLIDDMR